MLRSLRPFPYTLLTLAIVIGAAIWTKTHLGEMTSAHRNRFGFSPLHVLRGDWMRLLTCAFFTVGGMKFYASVAMLTVCLGAAEKFFGSIRAASLFWGVHIVTLLVTSLAISIPLHSMAFYHGSLLANADDVGPSAGYYGCLGAACVTLPPRWRFAIIGAVTALLAARLIWSLIAVPDDGRVLSADLGHIIAFPLGVAVASLGFISATS